MRNSLSIKRATMLKKVLKWIIYIILMLVAFIISTSGGTDTVMPLLLIPISICISTGEDEIVAGLVGLFCGLLIDTAGGKLLGSNGLFLLITSVVVSLLFLYLMRTNFINVLIVTIVITFLNMFYDYFFSFKLWGEDGHSIVLTKKLLPASIYTIISLPIIYFLIKLIYTKLAVKQRVVIEEENNAIDRI